MTERRGTREPRDDEVEERRSFSTDLGTHSRDGSMNDPVVSKNTNELKTCAHDRARRPGNRERRACESVRLLTRPPIGGRYGSK